MLCPEVTNFYPPKVITSYKKNQNMESTKQIIHRNSFYKSVIITLPDEVQTPCAIQKIISVDSDYYKLNDCPLIELVDFVFIDRFVKNGNLYCLSADKNCIVNNCVAITPDGILTLHILEFIYQTLGIEGIKRPNNYYQINIDLKYLKKFDRHKHILEKLGNFDFYIFWEPNMENVCPSSIAKYFYDRGIIVTVCTLKSRVAVPEIKEIPSLEGVEIDEMVEWVGMASHEANLAPEEAYVSTYSQPDSTKPLESTRMSIFIVKGFLTPNILSRICDNVSEYVSSRLLSNYWANVSLQSEETLWQWSNSTSRMFQSFNSSISIFFTQAEHIICTIGQLKYS